MEQSLDHNANKMQGVQRPGYPDVKKNTRRFRKAGRILLFISLAVEMLLAFINYLTFDAAPKYWSVVTGGIIAYLILTLWDIFSRRQGQSGHTIVSSATHTLHLLHLFMGKRTSHQKTVFINHNTPHSFQSPLQYHPPQGCGKILSVQMYLLREN